MFFESPHIRVTAEHGTATLWLRFRGEPINALDLDRLRELDAALQAVDATPAVRVLVLRSGVPGGFCVGLHPEAAASLTTNADAAAFAWYGQRVADRLANMKAATVAFIDGACLGTGLELSLACDYRLALANIAVPLGFTHAPCLGGSIRLPRLVGQTAANKLIQSNVKLSAREAKWLGLVDHAFCERRAKIELRTFLDRLERNPRKHIHVFADEGFAVERAAFGRALAEERTRRNRPEPKLPPLHNPIALLPEVVGILSEEPALHRFGAELAVRGRRVLVSDAEATKRHIVIAQRRGFLTPLEMEQTLGRITVVERMNVLLDAGLVFTSNAESLAPHVRPRCVIAACMGLRPARQVCSHPRRVIGVRFVNHSITELHPTPHTDNDTLAALCTWLKPLGFTTHILPRTIPLAQIPIPDLVAA